MRPKDARHDVCLYRSDYAPQYLPTCMSTCLASCMNSKEINNRSNIAAACGRRSRSTTSPTKALPIWDRTPRQHTNTKCCLPRCSITSLPTHTIFCFQPLPIPLRCKHWVLASAKRLQANCDLTPGFPVRMIFESTIYRFTHDYDKDLSTGGMELFLSRMFDDFDKLDWSDKFDCHTTL
ncbi:hypothetical protein AUEXF2481DRAFT_663949 [Aureobasidium subglaciale EXF-2481]|uniref:Uncharacterized protein n=1 Tax=Aureobasidium subglaciale (strain EXF-2481) TaxID=1043005 RepID=A0A074YQ26_AURSE|nr:uncharacterized protein AUEXF2481DRAFT_663949 [Aureobasidium subglaciale EXF-2481]KEQ96137.1 hypothetical protein AUEXF2481DRAFT_663949 [Aureobasidium subglaciale EXF-2481]